MPQIVGDTTCPQCRAHGRDRTGNHLILFDNGEGYCNRCHYKHPSGGLDLIDPIRDKGSSSSSPVDVEWLKDTFTPGDLTDRGITAATAEAYGVLVEHHPNKELPERHYYPVTNGGEVVGYKVREVATKKFYGIGSLKTEEFFGQHLLSGSGGKVFITEGECDAMAASQMLYEAVAQSARNKYGRPPVVSLPHGANAAKRYFVRWKYLLEGYKEIILLPDADEAGQLMVEAAVTVLDRSKLRVVDMPAGLKDPNDALLAGKQKQIQFIQAVLGGTQSRAASGLVHGTEITLDQLKEPINEGIYIPQYPTLSDLLGGFRYGKGSGEITIIVSGTGMGKTTMSKEIMYGLIENNHLKVGAIMLEEKYNRTAQSIIAIHNNIPVSALRIKPDLLSDADWEEGKQLLNNIIFMNHFASIDSQELIGKLHYMAEEGCSFIILDHISMVVSGIGNSGSERKDIDVLMTELAAFTTNTGVSIVGVVHLRRPSGDQGYNDGLKISLNALRGSAGLEQMAHNVIAIEGDQRQGRGNLRDLYVLKNREKGVLGSAGTLVYDFDTGRLLEKA